MILVSPNHSPLPRLAIDGGPRSREQPLPPWPEVGTGDALAVARVVESGQWSSIEGTGAVQAFCEEFARYLGTAAVITTTSGTQALRIALLAHGIGPGDEVVVPSYTFIATASACLEVGATPVLADIRPDTFGVDRTAVEAVLTARTRAIIVVHFGGMAVDLEGIVQMCRARSIPLIEDASHAHGSEWRGKRLGTWGSAGCFSFQASKNLTAGEGGAVATADPALAGRLGRLINFGRVNTEPPVEAFASNLRMTELQGALLSCQLARLPEQTARRDRHGRDLDRRISTIPGIIPQYLSPDQTVAARHLYIFRYDPAAFGGRDRQAFLAALRCEGIPAEGGYARPLSHHPLFRTAGGFPGAEEACRSAVWLPQNLLLDPAAPGEVAMAISKIHAHWG
jgi:dTDP-4-amino-4,6-dideoxygalactose transaminase